ncbi:MAG: glycosyltransferase family 4 protein [bacterium]|nr:glycosyltransferase family 4 protein [bacterium]
MSRVNVLYLVRTWEFGGSHTIVLHLLKHLPKDRFNIVCVPYEAFSKGDEAFVREAGKRGLAVADDRIPWRSRRDWGRARRTVLDLIERYHIDLLHTHDPHSNIMIGIGRKQWPCACVASAYGWWNGLFPIRRWMNIRVERRLALPRFEHVITVSNHMKGKIMRGPTPEDRIRVIHTGLDLATVQAADPDGSRQSVRDTYGIPKDAFVVGTVSRVSVEKGHSYLLRAVAEVAGECPKLHVLVVGNGPARQELEELAARLNVADRVTFTGFVDDLPGTLAAMDVVAQPSILEEGFPTSVLEAQAAGLAVVASDIGGTSETMHVGKTGLLVPPRDSDALARTLASLADDPNRCAGMGRAARNWVERSFTLETMVSQVSETYEEALSIRKADGP